MIKKGRLVIIKCEVLAFFQITGMLGSSSTHFIFTGFFVIKEPGSRMQINILGLGVKMWS
jgi:hypothetical protein